MRCPGSGFGAGQPFGAQRRIILCDRASLPEAAVKLVQGRRAKRPIAGNPHCSITAKVPHDRQSRAERCLIAVVEELPGGAPGGNRDSHRVSVVVAPIIPASPGDDCPSVADTKNIFAE